MAAPTVEDVRFLYDASTDTSLLARLYRPAGNGPFPVVIDLHGGAWTSGDRTQNVAIASALAEAGILVASLDFRMPPAKHYPDTLTDIHCGILWMKKRAVDFGGRPGWVGGFGTSSGGHLILLAGMRPLSQDAQLAYVISGWGVLDPLLRYRLAKEAGAQNFISAHHAFWGDKAAMSHGSPPLMLARGEKVETPPALIFQGDADEWVPQAMTKQFVDAYRKAGGEIELDLLPGAKHSFFREDSGGANARRAIEITRDYVLKRTVGR